MNYGVFLTMGNAGFMSSTVVRSSISQASNLYQRERTNNDDASDDDHSKHIKTHTQVILAVLQEEIEILNPQPYPKP